MEHSIVQKFAAVYAEAVLTFLDSGEEQWVTWDGLSHRFDFMSTELDEPETPALMIIGDDWEKRIGGVDEMTDPESQHYDVDALRSAIEYQLVEEGVGERILKDFVDRLEKAFDADEDEEDDERTDHRRDAGMSEEDDS